MKPGEPRSALPFVPAALAASGVGTWEYDVVRHLFYGDDVLAQIYGLTSEEAMAGISTQRLINCLHPADRAIGEAKLADLCENGGQFVVELRTAPVPGAVRWILVRGHFEKDRSGQVSRGRGIVIDLTEHKLESSDGDLWYSTLGGSAEETALDRAARHTLAARRAIDEVGDGMSRNLRPIVDALLLALGRCLALAGKAHGKH